MTILSLRALELLAALLLICASLMIAHYSSSPEDFFIRRFRQKSDAAITHMQLILRAFVGSGLIGAGGAALAMSILFANLSLASDFGIWALAFPATIGASVYAHFRTWRYRRASDGYAFERRPEVSGRQKRIRIALLAVTAALIAWTALTVALTRLGDI